MTAFEIILLSLVGSNWAAVGVVYAWTYKVSRDNTAALTKMQETITKELGKVYAVVNGHLQKQGIHIQADSFVSTEVCRVQHKFLKESLDRIEGNIKEILAKT